jgi:hypothetical protein
MSSMIHPLPLNTKVKANKPSCPCKNAKHIPVEGTILKVIQNASGCWYYLDAGITIKSEWVTSH